MDAPHNTDQQNEIIWQKRKKKSLSRTSEQLRCHEPTT